MFSHWEELQTRYFSTKLLNILRNSFYLPKSFLFNISRGFNCANWQTVDFSRGFIFTNLSFINVLYILIFSWFILQLVECESRNSYPNFLIFLIDYLDITDLILDWISNKKSKGADIIKRFTFFFLCSLYQQYLIIYIIIYILLFI